MKSDDGQSGLLYVLETHLAVTTEMDEGLCSRDKDLAQEGRAEDELRGLDNRSDGSRHCWLA